MTPELASVKEFVQQVVEAIAVALGIDVMVFDPERTILAGSGVTKAEIGIRYHESSLTGSILVTGNPLITRPLVARRNVDIVIDMALVCI